MDWHGRNTSSFASDIDRFCFEPKTNTVIQCYQYTVRFKAMSCVSTLIMSQNPDRVQHEVQKLPDHMLRAWLSNVRQEWMASRWTKTDGLSGTKSFKRNGTCSRYAYRVSVFDLAHGPHLMLSGSRIGQAMHRSNPTIQAPRL